MLERIESAGIHLELAANGKLAVYGAITTKQRAFLKANRLYIRAALKLRAMAPAADQPGLLKWYQGDMNMIADMGLEQLQYLVGDYLTNRDCYLHTRNASSD